MQRVAKLGCMVALAVVTVRANGDAAQFIEGDDQSGKPVIQIYKSSVPLEKLYPEQKFEPFPMPQDDGKEEEENPGEQLTSFEEENPLPDEDMFKILAEEVQHFEVVQVSPDDFVAPEQQVEQEKDSDPENTDDEPTNKNRLRRRSLNVFVPDERTISNVFSFPSRVVGLFVTVGGRCTGQLIGSGHTLVTNAHCIPVVNGAVHPNFFAQTRIYFGYSSPGDGTFTCTGVGWVRRVRAVLGSGSGHGIDYAVLQVEPATDGTQSPRIWPDGFLGAMVPANDDLEDEVFLVSNFAYSVDHAAFNMVGNLPVTQRVHSNCQTRGETFIGEAILHTCDNRNGASGSALVNAQNLVLAINYAQRCPSAPCATTTYSRYADSVGNLAVNMDKVIGDIRTFNALTPFTFSPTARPTNFPTPATSSPTPRRTMRKVTGHPTKRLTVKRVTKSPTKKLTKKKLW